MRITVTLDELLEIVRWADLVEGEYGEYSMNEQLYHRLKMLADKKHYEEQARLLEIAKHDAMIVAMHAVGPRGSDHIL